MYLIPQPQNLVMGGKNFLLQYDTEIVLDSKLTNHEYAYAKQLQQEIKEILGFHLPITRAFSVGANSIGLYINKEMKQQEYFLSIKEDRIEIVGGDSEALLYGIQTLRQIIRQECAVLPTLEIKDYPEIKHRGFYHDVTRGRVPTLDSLKRLVDKLSYYKLNQLQLYVEHSFLFKDFSEVWRDDTPLTAQEILDLDAYCVERNIELIPSIASFGHLDKVLKTKTYEHLCELENASHDEFTFSGRMEHHTVDVTNPESLEFIKRMLSEFMPLFTSKHFNICADETFDLGKGKSKELADKIGTHQVYVNFVKQLCDFVKSYGKRPMFWGDIILGCPEMIQQLPEDVICLNWGYCENEQEINAKKMYDVGATQYLCPGVHGWRHLMNRNDAAYGNVSRMCSYAHKYQAIGLLNTDWGDFGHTSDPKFSVVGMIYGAAFSWNSKILPFEEINEQISVVEFEDHSEQFVAIVSELARQEAIHWDHFVQYKEIEAAGGNKERMEEVWKTLAVQGEDEKNKKLSEAIHYLYQVMKHMDSSKRDSIRPYLIHAKGQYLLNQVAGILGTYVHGEERKETNDPKQVAIGLEYWFREYKENFRSTCKESEMHRVQEVVFWFADKLREL